MEGNYGEKERERVCVTGAGGYVASWVVKDLLSKGYFVHGTVRDPCDEKKNGHLKKLEKSAENLKLFKADLLDYGSLHAAIEGCTGVFHVACLIPGTQVLNPEVDVLEPAITSTVNVLNACSKAKVKKVVVVSSAAAVLLNPTWPKDEAMDESCWTDIEFCKTMEMQRERWDNRNYPLVDVQDVADAILLAYEKSEAEGRFICSSFSMPTKDLVEKLQNMFPDYKYPTSFTEVQKLNFGKLSPKKLENLGWKFKPLEETLTNAVKNFEENGLLIK